MKSRCEKSRGVRVSEFFKNCKNTLKKSSGEMKKSNPEKMGTSMWINREDRNESQGRECVQQIAYLVGIVVNDETPTTGWVTKMCRKNPEIESKFFLPVIFAGLDRAPISILPALVVGKI